MIDNVLIYEADLHASAFIVKISNWLLVLNFLFLIKIY